MNIKTSEFAARYGVSDRHVRRLLSDNAQTLDGHYERNTKGTWLDQYAADYLYGLLRNPVEILPVDFGPDPDELLSENEALKAERLELYKAIADAERRANKGAGAVALLEAAEGREAKLTEENKDLATAKALLEGERNLLKHENDNLKAENDDLSNENAEKDKSLKELAETSQALSDELTAIKGKWWYKLFARKKGEE